jgi:hypothetical protein
MSSLSDINKNLCKHLIKFYNSNRNKEKKISQNHSRKEIYASDMIKVEKIPPNIALKIKTTVK